MIPPALLILCIECSYALTGQAYRDPQSRGAYILRGSVMWYPGQCAFGWHGRKGFQNFLRLIPLRSWPRPWEFPNISLVLIEVAVSRRLV